jgi:hypothetical protein
MPDQDREALLIEWRNRLAGLGLPADDLDDETVLLNAQIRAMAEQLLRVVDYIVTRNVLHLLSSGELWILEQGDLRMIETLWTEWAPQLRPLSGRPDWPAWLPPVPD